MRKLKVILLAMLVLSPSLVSAKMIDIGEGNYINTDYISSVVEEKKGCAIYLGTGSTRSKYMDNRPCKDLLAAYDISITYDKTAKK